MGNGGVTGGKDNLEDISADGGEGGDAQQIDEHGEGQEAAAHAHDGGDDADHETADGHKDAGNAVAAGHQVFVKGDHGGQVDGLQLLSQTGGGGGDAAGLLGL